VIKGFADQATKDVFEGRQPKGIPSDILAAARRKLRQIAAATELTDLKVPPGNKLHPLLSDRAGQHAIWINAQFRICFQWKPDGVHAVEIVDYH
jgi:proteic killer suppression protein